MKKTIFISELRSIVREVLAEAIPPSSNKGKGPEVTDANKTPMRYRTDGTSTTDTAPSSSVSGSSNTQMPPTMHPPTIPAKASKVQRAADQQLKDMSKSGSVDPNRIPVNPRPESNKTGLVHRALLKQGMTADQLNIEDIQNWVKSLDPADALVKSADDLAKEYMSQNQQSGQNRVA